MALTEQEIQKALAQVCNQGPYTLDFNQSTQQIQVWHCQACGAVLRHGVTVTIPSWMHYKPGCEPVREQRV